MPAAVVCLLCFLVNAADGQDDLPVRPDPAVQQLATLGLSGNPVQVGQSIERLTRSGEIARADEVLRSVPGRGFDAAALNRLAEQIEPTTRLRLARQTDPAPETTAALELIRASREAVLKDPVALRAAVTKLASDDPTVRLAAAERLRAAGQFALPELLRGGLASGADLDAVVQIGRRIDPEVFAAGLRQKLLYGSPEQRSRAAEAILKIDDASVADDVLLIAADDSFDSLLADRAADWFTRHAMVNARPRGGGRAVAAAI